MARTAPHRDRAIDPSSAVGSWRPLESGRQNPVILGDTDLKNRRARRAAEGGASAGQVAAFLIAIDSFVHDFNLYAAREGLGLSVNARALKARVRGGYHAPVIAYFDGSETGGRIYDNQIETFARVHAALLRDPVSPHLILGAMQSGKTGSAILLTIHALAFYLMTGIPLSPLYLLPDFLGQEAQTGTELERFMLFYGLLEFRFDRTTFTAIPTCAGDEWDAMGHPPALCTTSPVLDRGFAKTPNLRTYLEAVLHVAQARDLIVRRSKGSAPLDRQMARMQAHDLVPLPILDEVQYGAVGTNGRASLTKRIKDRLEAVSVNGRAPRYVCASATPFVEKGKAVMKTVWQRLPANYSGIVHFLGDAYPGHEQARPLPVYGFSAFAEAHDLPMLRQINLGHYAKAASGRLDLAAFRAWGREVGYIAGNVRTTLVAKAYVDFVEDGLGAIVRKLARMEDGLAANGRPRGLCLRLRNNNAAATKLLARLNLEAHGIDVVRFFGKLDGRSLRQVIATRARPDLPYLVVVTARARMADAFPAEVEHFIDCVDKTADYNALLQGFVGRAMGANKTSTVILTDENATVLHDYVATRGSLQIPATPHGHNVGATTPARETTVYRVKRGDHPRTDAFLDEIQHRIVDRCIRTQAGAKFPRLERRQLDHLYGRSVDLHVNLLALVRDFGLNDLIREQPALIMGGFAGTARIAGALDQVRHPDGTLYGYVCDPTDPDFIKIGLRTTDAKDGRGWRTDVFRKGREASELDRLHNKPRALDHLEPSLGLTPTETGLYRLDYVDLPLATSVRVAGEGTMTVLAAAGHFEDREAPCERLVRDSYLLARGRSAGRQRATGIAR